MIFNGTISDVRKVSKITKAANSYGPIVEIGNVPWKTSIRWNNSEDWLGVFASVSNMPKSNLWSCDVTAVFHMMKGESEHGAMKVNAMRFTKCFKSDVADWGFPNFIKKDELLDRRNDFLIGDEFRIVVELEVKDPIGFIERPISDFSVPRGIGTEIELCVEGRYLYFDKCALMCFSSTFREILSCDDCQELEIPDTEYSTVVAFLRILNKGKQITEKTVEPLLSLADRYNVHFLISHCEDYLISSKTITIDKKVRLAESYHLSSLQKNIVENATKEDLKKINHLMLNMGALTAKPLLVKLCNEDDEKGKTTKRPDQKRSFRNAWIPECLILMCTASRRRQQ